MKIKTTHNFYKKKLKEKKQQKIVKFIVKQKQEIKNNSRGVKEKCFKSEQQKEKFNFPFQRKKEKQQEVLCSK